MKLGKFLFGVFFILFGLIFLLINMGIIVNFTFFTGIDSVWPVLLIISGIFFVAKRRIWGSLFLVLSILILILSSLINNVNFQYYDSYLSHEYGGEEELSVSFDFGAADFYLNSTMPLKDSLFELNSTSTFVEEYAYDLDFRDNQANLNIFEKNSRDINVFNLFHFNGGEGGSDIDLLLNPNPDINLNLNYGAVDALIDLRELNITKLNIDSGATASVIYFGDKPLDVSVDTGASEFIFYFNPNIGVEVRIDGGVVDVNLEGFKKVGNKYYSNGFNSSNENIFIDIDAGVSSIEGEFIENE